MLATKYTEPRRAFEELEKTLRDWHNLDEGGHLSPAEDKLGTQRPKQEDASFELSSNLRMDAETALLKCGAPFRDKQMTFIYLTLGWHWRTAEKWKASRSHADRVKDRTLWKMVEYLTGKREN